MPVRGQKFLTKYPPPGIIPIIGVCRSHVTSTHRVARMNRRTSAILRNRDI